MHGCTTHQRYIRCMALQSTTHSSSGGCRGAPLYQWPDDYLLSPCATNRPFVLPLVVRLLPHRHGVLRRLPHQAAKGKWGVFYTRVIFFISHACQQNPDIPRDPAKETPPCPHHACAVQISARLLPSKHLSFRHCVPQHSERGGVLPLCVLMHSERGGLYTYMHMHMEARQT